MHEREAPAVPPSQRRVRRGGRLSQVLSTGDRPDARESSVGSAACVAGSVDRTCIRDAAESRRRWFGCGPLFGRLESVDVGWQIVFGARGVPDLGSIR